MLCGSRCFKRADTEGHYLLGEQTEMVSIYKVEL